MISTVSMERVNKVYPNGFHAVRDLDLDVAEGELMVLVGPSGCGKTTALRMVAGLEDITSGTLRIGSSVVNALPPKDRNIAMVFQNYALYPHLTVAENISFPLKIHKLPKDQIERKLRETAQMLGLADLLDQKPAQLSGGQRQRVAMGRAIVREPSVFLMDEPLSNLDAKLRVAMRAEVSRIQRQLKVATLYVTHDQTEAMTMGDRVAVMNVGVLQQVDDPQVLYDHPQNVFVAAFIGSPAMNLYEAQLGPEASSLHIGSQTLTLAESVAIARPGLAGYTGRKVVVGFRPEHLPVATGTSSQYIEGDVGLVEALGSELLVHFNLDAPRVRVEGDQVAEDAEALLAKSGEGVARVDPRATVVVGARARFAVDTERLQFFDPESRAAIWS
jgi:ABC-type sugar transport systems, ATPase components